MIYFCDDFRFDCNEAEALTDVDEDDDEVNGVTGEDNINIVYFFLCVLFIIFFFMYNHKLIGSKFYYAYK